MDVTPAAMEVDVKYGSYSQEIRDILEYVNDKKMSEWKKTLSVTVDTLAIAKHVLTPEFAKAHPEWSRRLRFLCDAEVVHYALTHTTKSLFGV